MKIIAVFFVFIYCMTSCLQKKYEEGFIKSSSIEIINVKPNMLKKMYLSSLVNCMNVIPLETTDFSLLSGVSKVEIDDDNIFVQNAEDKLIYVFDLNGRFKYCIGRKGNGPEEVQYPECFALNKNDKEVYLNNNYNSIYKYDYNGGFKSKEKFDLFYKKFVVSVDGDIYYHASKFLNYSPVNGEDVCWNLWINSSNGNMLKTYFQYDSKLYPNGSTYFDTKTPFSVLDTSVTYHYVFCDTIYSISKDEISPKYIVDYGGNKSRVDLGNLPGEEALKYLLSANDNQAYYLHDVIETSLFVKFKYLMNNQIFDAFYFKESKSVSDGVLDNDILGGKITFLYGCGNKIVGVMEPSEIKVNSKSVSFLNDSIINILKNVNEDSNPLLIECQIN